MEEVKTCPHCGALATANRTKCWRCGKRIRMFAKRRPGNQTVTTVVSYGLLIINIIAFFLIPQEKTAIIPYLVWSGEYWRLLTCVFTHFGMGHIVMNMMSLMIIGTRLERYFGSWMFALIYVLCGFGGSIASLLLTRGFSGGASGAIMGLFGLIFVYTRKTNSDIEGLSKAWTIQVLIINVIFAFTWPNIDHWGHIGGFLVGALVGGVLASREIRGGHGR